jgi:signal transduction histidine kinase
MNPLALLGYPLFGAAALNFVFGAFLLARGSKKDPVPTYTAAMAFLSGLYCLTIAIAYVRASRGLPWDFYYRSAWVGWLALAPLNQVILVLRGEPRRARWLGGALYAFWGTILVLCWTTDLIEVGAVSLFPFVDRLGRFETLARLLGAATLTFFLYQMYRVWRGSVGRRRQQLGYFLLGMGLYAAAGLVLAGLAGLIPALRFDPGLVSYFSVAWMALTFYAVTRHRLFDIRVVLSRSIEALVLTSLLAAAVVLLHLFLEPAVGRNASVPLVGILVGVLFFMTPVHALLRLATQRLLLGPRHDAQRALQEAARALASAESVADVLQQLLHVTRRTLAVSSGALLLADEGRLSLKQSYGIAAGPTGLALEGPLCQWLATRRQIFIRDEQQGVLTEAELTAVDADLVPFGGEVAVPLGAPGVLAGVLVLGRKSDKDAYLQSDVAILEMMASEATVALANARLVEELRQAVLVRDDFLSVAGHELRTPLTALQLRLQGLMQTPAKPEQARERLTALMRQVSRMTRLVNQLLDVSRISAHKLVLEREEVDLAALVEDVAGRFAEELRLEDTALELTLSPHVRGQWDRVRLEQVVSNLLSNAIKYGERRPVRVAVEPSGGGAKLTVQDKGIGIAQGDQQRIFARFERAVSQQHYGGLGLGLWISKQVIEAHGGSIDVMSAPQEGATFVVELPET